MSKKVDKIIRKSNILNKKINEMILEFENKHKVKKIGNIQIGFFIDVVLIND